jgi:hypothetical protein
MRKVFVIAPLLCTAFATGSIAQTPSRKSEAPAKVVAAANPPTSSPCPKIEFQGQAPQTVRDGQPVTFGVNIAGGDPDVAPTIVWNVSAGSIKDGQGTRRIEVDSTGAGSDRQIIADVWVGGFAPECSNQATVAIKVVGHAIKIDEFGNLDPEKENERLSEIAATVSQSSDNLYIIAYSGRSSVRGFAATGLRRIKTQLASLGVQAQRIGNIDGGYREDAAYEIWMVPEGADPPRPTPTIDRKQIVYPSPVPIRTPVKTTVKKP